MTRKNAGGSQNPDTARTAADIWTIIATAQMAELNTITYLTAYLDECGHNGGKPLPGEALSRFLPWKASPEDLRTWGPATAERQNPRSVTPPPAWPPAIPTPGAGVSFHRTSEHLPWYGVQAQPRKNACSSVSEASRSIITASRF